jgi:hypothetical protein
MKHLRIGVNEKSRFDIAGLVESALSTHEEQVRIGQSRKMVTRVFV